MVAFYALDGAGLANYEPQVLMRGGHLGKKVIYIDMPAPDNRVKTRQDIPLTEVRRTPETIPKAEVKPINPTNELI